MTLLVLTNRLDPSVVSLVSWVNLFLVRLFGCIQSVGLLSVNLSDSSLSWHILVVLDYWRTLLLL